MCTASGKVISATRRQMGACAAAVLCLSLALADANADTAKGYEAYRKTDYVTAAREFRSSAEQGDPAARIALGWLYDNGLGVAHDDGEAAKWYRLAADQGCPLAQQYLGIMYAEGQGVPKDYAKAAEWFRAAAERGDAGGAYGLGAVFRDGAGAPRSAAAAYQWFSLAALWAKEDVQKQQALAAQSELSSELTPAERETAEAWAMSQRASKETNPRCETRLNFPSPNPSKAH